LAPSPADLCAPRQAYRAPAHSAWLHYSLAEEPKGTVTLEILDGKGNVIQTFTSKPEEGQEEARAEEEQEPPRRPGDRRVSAKAGINRFTWDLSYAAPFTVPPRIVMWGGARRLGPKAVPGRYQVR